MIEFSTILAQLEDPTRHVEDSASHSRFPSVEGMLGDQAGDAHRTKLTQTRADYATAAYGAASSEPRGEDTDAPSSPGAGPTAISGLNSLLDELHLAKDSMETLRSLRRRLAWICHPDRQRFAPDLQAENLMAELNTRIDAALTELASRAAKRKRSR